MKILFVGYNLFTGGVQKSLVNTLIETNRFLDAEIELFLFSNKGEMMKEVPENVKVIKGNYFLRLSATPFSMIIREHNLINIVSRIILMLLVRIIGSKMFYNLMFFIQKDTDSYDIAISYFNDVPENYFNQGCNQYVINHVKTMKKIAWIHTDPIKANFNYNYSKKIYEKFDTIVNVSKASKEKFDNFLEVYKKKSFVVYNFFPYEKFEEKSLSLNPVFIFNSSVLNFVTVARIENKSKRIDRIIVVSKLLKESGTTNFKWRIIGDGPDLRSVKSLMERNEVGDLIEFIGEKDNPLPYIRNSDAFILTSDFEGYPMVVGEALGLGIPVITTAYASAHEQIINGVNGLIVNNNSTDLFESIKLILSNKQFLDELKRNAKNNQLNNDIATKQLLNILQ